MSNKSTLDQCQSSKAAQRSSTAMMLDTGPDHPGAEKASRWLLIKRSDGLDVPGRAARHPRDCLSALTPSLARAGNFIPTLVSLGHANAQSKKRVPKQRPGTVMIPCTGVGHRA